LSIDAFEPRTGQHQEPQENRAALSALPAIEPGATFSRLELLLLALAQASLAKRPGNLEFCSGLLNYSVSDILTGLECAGLFASCR
jgi:hypothetical protein